MLRVARGDPAELERAIDQCLAPDSGARKRLAPGAREEAGEENLQAVLRLYRELSG